MDLNAWSEKLHQTAVEKGWWEKHSSPMDGAVEKAVLIVTELAEAVEAYRENRIAIEVSDMTGKPDGFAVEIADAVIRALDLAGAFTRCELTSLKPREAVNEFCGLGDEVDALEWPTCLDYNDRRADHDVLWLVRAASRCALAEIETPVEVMTHVIGGTIFWCELIATRVGFDLEEAVRVKAEFNKTRGHRHGGRVA